MEKVQQSTPSPVHPPGTVFALYDVKGKCWLGTDDGVKTYDDWEVACMAATVVGEQLGSLLRAQPYDGSAKVLKDEVPTRMTAEQAVINVEGRAR